MYFIQLDVLPKPKLVVSCPVVLITPGFATRSREDQTNRWVADLSDDGDSHDCDCDCDCDCHCDEDDDDDDDGCAVVVAVDVVGGSVKSAAPPLVLMLMLPPLTIS